jgi:hypothetical protein
VPMERAPHGKVRQIREALVQKPDDLLDEHWLLISQSAMYVRSELGAKPESDR